MKMIIVILSDTDSEPVSQALVQAGFRATRIASTGAFLRSGSSTLLIGVESQRVDEAIQVVRDTAGSANPGARRATLFVVDVQQFVQV